MSLDIVILHGTMGSPAGNWFPWLKEEMQAKGHTVYVPTFPTPEGQSKDGWSAALKEQTPRLGEKTILIGHSCGATFIPHILEGASTPVKQAIMVSPFIGALGNTEYDELNKTFYDHVFDWPAIRANVNKLEIFHGSDDPYVPLDHAERFAEELPALLHVIDGGGHLNSESGYNAFPELLEVLDA